MASSLLQQAVDLHPRVREPLEPVTELLFVSGTPRPCWGSTRSSTARSRRCSTPPTRPNNRCWSASYWCAVSTCDFPLDADSCASSRRDGRRESNALARLVATRVRPRRARPGITLGRRARCPERGVCRRPSGGGHRPPEGDGVCVRSRGNGGGARRATRRLGVGSAERCRGPPRLGTGGASSTRRYGKPTLVKSNWSLEWAASVHARRDQLAQLGGPHPYLAWLAIAEAYQLFMVGAWKEATQVLRVALGSDPGHLR